MAGPDFRGRILTLLGQVVFGQPPVGHIPEGMEVICRDHLDRLPRGSMCSRGNGILHSLEKGLPPSDRTPYGDTFR